MMGRSTSLCVVIAAGGTGGHVYPGVALAWEFLRQEPITDIVFTGTPRGIEAKVLAHEGFDLVFIAAQPFMGVGVWGALRGIAALPCGIWQAWSLLRTRRADLVVAVGGYTSPAVVVAAWLLRIPRVILEPNAYPGLANKVLAPLADRVFLAFDAAASEFRGARTSVVGSPIRREVAAQATREGDGQGPPVLLVFGGSQGARAINQAMIEALPHLEKIKHGLAVVHQAGEADEQRVRAAYEEAGFRATVVPFLFDLPRWLQEASLVVARSGAMTLAELTACGKPAVLIPLPHAIYNHQLKNAQVLEEAGAAMIIQQDVLTGERLGALVTALLSDPSRLATMRARSHSLRRIDAAEVIVNECLALVRRGSRSG